MDQLPYEIVRHIIEYVPEYGFAVNHELHDLTGRPSYYATMRNFLHQTGIQEEEFASHIMEKVANYCDRYLTHSQQLSFAPYIYVENHINGLHPFDLVGLYLEANNYHHCDLVNMMDNMGYSDMVDYDEVRYLDNCRYTNRAICVCVAYKKGFVNEDDCVNEIDHLIRDAYDEKDVIRCILNVVNFTKK